MALLDEDRLEVLPPRAKVSQRGNPDQLLNAAFLALVVIERAPSLSARSDPDWNCDIPSPYRRRA
jgi:hypothetical protein